MPKTRPRTGSYMLRFARLGGQIIAFSRVRVHIGGQGQGKQPRIRLFTERGLFVDVEPAEFRDMVQDGTVEQLALPHELREDAEQLSEEIGPTYTPQEALSILQTMIQEHATTLSAEVVGRA